MSKTMLQFNLTKNYSNSRKILNSTTLVWLLRLENCNHIFSIVKQAINALKPSGAVMELKPVEMKFINL